MPAPIIPWQPSNIPIEIQQELDRRKTVRSLSYTSNQKTGIWDDKNGDWKTYKGPMTAWVRMCSNSAGHPAVGKPRFVFYGGKDFYNTYGFKAYGNLGSMNQIIGYMPTNPPIPHTIKSSLLTTGGEPRQHPIHVPTPEISKITTTVQKELFRRAEVEWTCFSWEQLVYMTPYLLVPGISVMLEWGWNHFNPTSLVPLDDEDKMVKLWRNAYPLYIDNVIKSRGNYDVLYGIITNFNWSMEGNKIICNTEITSKDRLYAGISKDMGLTVNTGTSADEPRPIFQALRDFISKDATLLNIKSIAESESGTEVTKLTEGNVPISGSVKGAENQNIIWRDILRPILSEPDPKIRGLKVPYIHGVFSGRPKKFYNDPIGLGKPHKNDFDKSNIDKLNPSKVWMNMGLIVEILNYFSNLDGGKGEPMFQVDILGTVIGAHPNMISCNRDVLIPNDGAPKAHFGNIGWKNYGYVDATIPENFLSSVVRSFTTNESGESKEGSEYRKQYKEPIKVETIADKILKRVCYQNVPEQGAAGVNACYRDDLDWPINFLRYKYRSSPERGSSYKGHSNYQNFFAFPAIEDIQLPPSSTGLGKPKGNRVESGVSGLLSDIYLSYSAFQMAIQDPDPKNGSYVDIYRKILSILNDSVDGFWDLVLVECDNVMTIMDKNYIGTMNKDENPTYTFDYFDADSIIKSLRFRPALTDAQATRAIYGETNNANSKYVFVDKNDLLNYQFKDAIIMNSKDRNQGDPNSDLAKRNTAKQQMADILGEVQKFSTSEDDDSLQMTINRGSVTTKTIGTGAHLGSGNVSTMTTETENGPFEYLKLCLPSSVGKQVFRLLIDDKDEENNPRYCAVQPGITLELTIQGCGGLRTFQYFLVKNLPEPYSHRNIIFRIQDVKHVISQEGNGWDTVITAGILPLRKYIKTRLASPVGGWAPEVVNATIVK